MKVSAEATIRQIGLKEHGYDEDKETGVIVMKVNCELLSDSCIIILPVKQWEHCRLSDKIKVTIEKLTESKQDTD